MIELGSTRSLHVSNYNHSKFTQDKVDCAACGMTAPKDGTWGQLCGKCGTRLRMIDASSVSRLGIWHDMWMMGIPVRGTREQG